LAQQHRRAILAIHHAAARELVCTGMIRAGGRDRMEGDAQDDPVGDVRGTIGILKDAGAQVTGQQ
jgi:hypothetical protein